MKGATRALLAVAAMAAAAWADLVTAAWGFIRVHGQTCNFDTRVMRNDPGGSVTATKVDDPQWTKTVWVFLDEGKLIYRFDNYTVGYLEPNCWYNMTGKVGNRILCPRRFYYGPQSVRCDLIQHPTIAEKAPEE